MLVRFYFLFLCIAATWPCFAQTHLQLANKTFPEQRRIIDSLRHTVGKDTTVTLQQLYDLYLQNAIEADNHEFEMLLQIESLFHAYIQKEITNTNFITTLRTLRKKCIKKDWKHLAAVAYNIEAIYWKRNGVLAEQLNYDLKAFELYKDLDHEFFLGKKHKIVQIAEQYIRFNDDENALKYFRIADQASPKFEAAVDNGIALVYTSMGEYDSALYYYDKLYRGAVENNNTVYTILALANRVEIYLKQKEYDTAQAMILSYLPDIEGKIGIHHVAADYGRLAYIKLMLNEADEADKYIHIALEKYRTEDPYWYYLRPKYAYIAFDHMARVKAALKQYHLAYLYSDSARMIKDTMYEQYNTVKLKNIEKELAKTKLDYMNQSLAFKQKEIYQQRNLWIMTIIAAASIILLIVYRYQRRREQLVNEKDLAVSSLQESRDKLANFTKSIQEKNSKLEKMEQQLKSYSDNEDATYHQESISELRSSTILTDNDWTQFRDAFEKVYIGYLSRLNEKYPSLTPSEIRYFVLAKLGMSNKEMAAVLGVSSAGIRTIRYRILKKIALPEDVTLENIIENI